MTASAATVVPAEAPRATVSLRWALGATVATLMVAAVLEAAFYGRGGHDALSDIPGRYFAWNVHPRLLPFGGHPIEYPVVVRYATWLIAWFGRSATGFFVVTGLLGAGLALVMTAMLHRRGGNRIWRWALGAPLALYAFHNWDLLAMVPAVAGLLAFDRHRDRTSGALLALGGFAKVSAHAPGVGDALSLASVVVAVAGHRTTTSGCFPSSSWSQWRAGCSSGSWRPRSASSCWCTDTCTASGPRALSRRCCRGWSRCAHSRSSR